MRNQDHRQRVITETINSRSQPFMASEQPCKAGKEWKNGNLKLSRDHSHALKSYITRNIGQNCVRIWNYVILNFQYGGETFRVDCMSLSLNVKIRTL